MKTRNVTEQQKQIIREIFTSHKTSVENVLLGIKEAKTYLENNIEKSGLYEFAVRTMESQTDKNFPEENMLACQLYSDLNSQLIGEAEFGSG